MRLVLFGKIRIPGHLEHRRAGVSHANVLPGVSVGLVLAMPVLLVVQDGWVAVPLRYFVTPETCQSASSHLRIGVSNT